jgi:hypothetical protein
MHAPLRPYHAFGLIGTTFRELGWKTLIFLERAVPVSPNAWYVSTRAVGGRARRQDVAAVGVDGGAADDVDGLAGVIRGRDRADLRWVGLGWVGWGGVGLGWAGLGWVGLGRVGSGRVGSGLVRSGLGDGGVGAPTWTVA